MPPGGRSGSRTRCDDKWSPYVANRSVELPIARSERHSTTDPRADPPRSGIRRPRTDPPRSAEHDLTVRTRTAISLRTMNVQSYFSIVRRPCFRGALRT